MFFYEKHPERSTNPIDIKRCDATKCYLEHYGNSLVLKFFMLKGTRVEKQDASQELTICERKMKFWTMQENFDQARMIREVATMNKNWKE